MNILLQWIASLTVDHIQLWVLIQWKSILRTCCTSISFPLWLEKWNIDSRRQFWKSLTLSQSQMRPLHCCALLTPMTKLCLNTLKSSQIFWTGMRICQVHWMTSKVWAVNPNFFRVSTPGYQYQLQVWIYDSSGQMILFLERQKYRYQSLIPMRVSDFSYPLHPLNSYSTEHHKILAGRWKFCEMKNASH